MEAQSILVKTGHPYQVLVGFGLLDRIGSALARLSFGRRVCIVADFTVGKLYLARVRESLESQGFQVSEFLFMPGEASKCPEVYLRLVNHLVFEGFSRKDTLVALGGGVVGDLCGFAAATYMRGCHLIQLPTSLLAMVDSSVGGKTALDLPQAKNMIGAFYQPDLVMADVASLATLTPEQFSDGCAEVVKHAIIQDPELFQELERHPLTPALLEVDPQMAACIIAQNIIIKRDIVQEDEREGNIRQLLNFGHSFGHAVESCSHYTLGHGQSVARGIEMIARLSCSLGKLEKASYARMVALLESMGLETTQHLSAQDLYRALRHDKKASGERINLVLPYDIGDCRIESVSFAELENYCKTVAGSQGV